MELERWEQPSGLTTNGGTTITPSDYTFNTTAGTIPLVAYPGNAT